MALILALNPGNRHSPTLSRLARELHGCELIGAESCAVAIKAIRERVPDVVLLPAQPGATSVIVDSDPGLAAGDTVQIDDGLTAEFPQLGAAPSAAAAGA